jgi:hypothetical protein
VPSLANASPLGPLPGQIASHGGEPYQKVKLEPWEPGAMPWRALPMGWLGMVLLGGASPGPPPGPSVGLWNPVDLAKFSDFLAISLVLSEA